MADHKRTQKIFEDLGISKMYKKPQTQLGEELFNRQITNPDTGAPYKISD